MLAMCCDAPVFEWQFTHGILASVRYLQMTAIHRRPTILYHMFAEENLAGRRALRRKARTADGSLYSAHPASINGINALVFVNTCPPHGAVNIYI